MIIQFVCIRYAFDLGCAGTIAQLLFKYSSVGEQSDYQQVIFAVENTFKMGKCREDVIFSVIATDANFRHAKFRCVQTELLYGRCLKQNLLNICIWHVVMINGMRLCTLFHHQIILTLLYIKSVYLIDCWLYWFA